jgi:hypothetical protein
MTKEQEQIWNLVHEWCNEQSYEIPDFNRRVLMERILALRQPLVSGRSEQLLALAQYMCEHQNNLDGKTAKDYLKDFLSQ